MRTIIKTKKCLSVLLTLILFLSILPAFTLTAAAAGNPDPGGPYYDPYYPDEPPYIPDDPYVPPTPEPPEPPAPPPGPGGPGGPGSSGEAECGISKKDFLAKIYIALKECAETIYWLELLKETQYLTEDEFISMYNDCEELRRMLSATTKTVSSTLHSSHSTLN